MEEFTAKQSGDITSGTFSVRLKAIDYSTSRETLRIDRDSIVSVRKRKQYVNKLLLYGIGMIPSGIATFVTCLVASAWLSGISFNDVTSRFGLISSIESFIQLLATLLQFLGIGLGGLLLISGVVLTAYGYLLNGHKIVISVSSGDTFSFIFSEKEAAESVVDLLVDGE